MPGRDCVLTGTLRVAAQAGAVTGAFGAGRQCKKLRGVIACLPGVGVLGPHAPSVRSERVATVSTIFFIDVSVDIESYRSKVRQAYLPRQGEILFILDQCQAFDSPTWLGDFQAPATAIVCDTSLHRTILALDRVQSKGLETRHSHWNT